MPSQDGLDDERAIERLIVRYATLADGGGGPEMVELFTDDAEFRMPGRTFAGRERLARVFGAAPAEPPGTMHALSNIAVAVDGAAASSVTYFQVLGASGLQAWGRYEDQLRRTDGTWRIAIRDVVIVGSANGA